MGIFWFHCQRGQYFGRGHPGYNTCRVMPARIYTRTGFYTFLSAHAGWIRGGGGVCPIVSSYKALFSVADFEDFHDADTLGALQAADDE